MRRKTSRIVSLGVSLILALATVAVGSGSAAAGQDSDPPDIPTNLRITDLGPNDATVAWDASAGATDYVVTLYSGNAHYGTSKATEELSHHFYLSQGIDYRVTVQARGEGISAQSDPVAFTTPVDPDNPPVTMPANIVPDVEESSVQVTLTWDPSTSEAGGVRYTVLLEERPCCSRKFLGADEPALTRFLQPGQTYRVRVKARDAANRHTLYSDPVEFTTPDESPVSTPGNVRVTGSPGTVTVDWDPSSSEAGIAEYTATLRGSSGLPMATRRTTDTTATFEHPPGGEFSVTVEARDTAIRWSDPSEPVEFTMEPTEDWEPPSTPGNFRATPTDSGVLFQWDEPVEGLGPFTYEIYIAGSEVEEVRGDLQLDSEYFFDCNTHPRLTPSEFTITAKSHGFVSPHSEPITLCF